MATAFVLLGLVLHRLLHHVHERAATALVPTSVGEFGLLLYLLIRGTRAGSLPGEPARPTP